MPSTPVVSAFCVLSTWLLCDFHRIGLYTGDAGVRGTSLVAALIGGGLLGGVIDRPVVRARTWRVFAAVLVLVPFVGLLVSLAGMVPATRGTRSALVATGVASSLALVPLVLFLVGAVGAVGRARPRSLVDDSDRRAVWGYVAAAIAIGSIPAVLGTPNLPRSTWAGAELSLSVAALATIAAAAYFVSDLAALRVASSLLVARLRPAECDADDDDESAPCFVDLGLGEATLERIVGGAGAYRSRAQVDAVVRGDPFLAEHALRRAALRSGLVAAAAVCGLALAFVCPST